MYSSPPRRRRSDTPTSTASTCRRPNELVANGRTVEEVQEIIGADWLVYQDLNDLELAVDHEDANIDAFDTSCFSGEYVTGDVSRDYLERLQIVRSDSAKARRDCARAARKRVGIVAKAIPCRPQADCRLHRSAKCARALAA